jgi:hypothetical protein
MTSIKPRSHVLSIRLSDEEMTELQALCEAYGARSLSEGARLAVTTLTTRRRESSCRDPLVEDVRKRICTLDRKIDAISAYLSVNNTVSE